MNSFVIVKFAHLVQPAFLKGSPRQLLHEDGTSLLKTHDASFRKRVINHDVIQSKKPRINTCRMLYFKKSDRPKGILFKPDHVDPSNRLYCPLRRDDLKLGDAFLSEPLIITNCLPSIRPWDPHLKTLEFSNFDYHVLDLLMSKACLCLEDLGGLLRWSSNFW